VGAEGFAQDLGAYLADVRRRRFSSALEEHALYVLPRLFSFLDERGVSDARSVEEADVVAFLSERKAAVTARGGLPSDSTVYVHFVTVRRFFTFLVRRRRILSDPTRHLHLPRPKQLPKVILSESEVRRLLEAPYPQGKRRKSWPSFERRDRAILEVLYGTGMRLGECARLDVRDVDLSRTEVLIRNGKGRRDRIVPLAGAACDATAEYLRHCRQQFLRNPREEALFVTWQGRRLSPITIPFILRRQAKQAGLDVKVSPHMLRHACATHLLKHGASIRHIQRLLGHESIRTTTIYTAVLGADVRAMVRRCHPRELRSSRPSCNRN
jgi:integrase/recombinase XerD